MLNNKYVRYLHFTHKSGKEKGHSWIWNTESVPDTGIVKINCRERKMVLITVV